jgi:ribosome-associated protein
MIEKAAILREPSFKAVRSSGSGGQNVNKVATCVQLYFDVDNSFLLTEDQKAKVKKHLKNRINSEGVLMIDCSESRSQARNKQLVMDKFFELLLTAFREKKKRIKTHIPHGVSENRLKVKKQKAEIKAGRRYRFE